MILDQPIAKLRWLPRHALSPNGWNPNHVAPDEMDLLATSLLENGWTAPITFLEMPESDGGELIIVDGFHRWTLTGSRIDIATLTMGDDGVVYVPAVPLDPTTDEATMRMATIRLNRARGAHHVLRMADVVAELVDLGVSDDEIARRVGMNQVEVERLRQRGKMSVRGAAPDGRLGNAWRPELKP